MTLPADIEQRWTSGVVLKRDLFSTVERGRYRGPDGEVDAVLRRIDQVPWWTYGISRALLERERRALAIADGLNIAPPLLAAGRNALVRGWIDGVALQIAQPYGDVAYFDSAKAALAKLHRAGICHNDLSKQQNWLRGSDGRAFLTDFQLAVCFRGRGPLFRLLAREDLRHLVKHMHRYVREAMTPDEWRLRDRKSLFARVWLRTGKKVYMWVTRGLFHFADLEGGGQRLVFDSPRIIECLKTDPRVRDVAAVAFYSHGNNKLYAFVEGGPELSEVALRERLAQSLGGVVAPECIQIVDALPRRPSGEVRTELLQLIASNQIDQIHFLPANENERAAIGAIVAGRQNLSDKF